MLRRHVMIPDSTLINWQWEDIFSKCVCRVSKCPLKVYVLAKDWWPNYHRLFIVNCRLQMLKKSTVSASLKRSHFYSLTLNRNPSRCILYFQSINIAPALLTLHKITLGKEILPLWRKDKKPTLQVNQPGVALTKSPPNPKSNGKPSPYFDFSK